jgi:hypothetical protein
MVVKTYFLLAANGLNLPVDGTLEINSDITELSAFEKTWSFQVG